MKNLKSKLKSSLSLTYCLLALISCNSESQVEEVSKKTIKDTVNIEEVKVDSITSVIEKVQQFDSKDKIAKIYGMGLAHLTEQYINKRSVESENDFLVLYQNLIGLQASFSEKTSIDFDKYYSQLINDTLVNQEISPLKFDCIEECTSPFIGIETNSLMTIAKKSNSQKAVKFVQALQYAYPRMEHEYVAFLEYCDECFGATSNIGDNRIYEFLKLCKPLETDNTVLGARLTEIKEKALDLAIGETYRFSADSVKIELQKWIDEDMLSTSKKEIVQTKIDEITKGDNKNKFNFVSDSYPEMHN